MSYPHLVSCGQSRTLVTRGIKTWQKPETALEKSLAPRVAKPPKRERQIQIQPAMIPSLYTFMTKKNNNKKEKANNMRKVNPSPDSLLLCGKRFISWWCSGVGCGASRCCWGVGGSTSRCHCWVRCDTPWWSCRVAWCPSWLLWRIRSHCYWLTRRKGWGSCSLLNRVGCWPTLRWRVLSSFIFKYKHMISKDKRNHITITSLIILLSNVCAY